MKKDDDLQRENEALRERLSRLSEASLRITEDLDLDTVLHRVLEGARSLTGARMGGITLQEEALSLMEETRPRLVLLDLMLPDTDGIELMRGILDIADVPVIFLSGYGRDTVIAGALQAGAADYVVKPFSPTELVARIQVALRRRLLLVVEHC